MAISKKTREEVYRKYDGHCAYCGREIAYKDMQVDHFITRAYLKCLLFAKTNAACRRELTRRLWMRFLGL